MSPNFYVTLVPDIACFGAYPGCALPVTSVRFGAAAAVLSSSFYIIHTFGMYREWGRNKRCAPAHNPYEV